MLGLHFFMPAHLVPLVEVVRSEASAAELAEKLGEVTRSLGKVRFRSEKMYRAFWQTECNTPSRGKRLP